MSGLLCSLKGCQSLWRMPETVQPLSYHNDSRKRCPDDLTPRSPIPRRPGRAPFPYRAFTGYHYPHSKSIPERHSHSSDANEELGCNRGALACRLPFSFLYSERLGPTMGWQLHGLQDGVRILHPLSSHSNSRQRNQIKAPTKLYSQYRISA
jgi:hypothetical protein